MNYLGKHDNVLVIWNNSDQDSLKNFCLEVKSFTDGSVVLEESGRLSQSSHPHSSVEVVLSNVMSPYGVEHTDELLATIIKFLKPNGKLVLQDSQDLTFSLKLAGFLNIQKNPDNTITCEKPNYEVGSKSSLKLKQGSQTENKAVDPWSIIDSEDLIESDLLLDENDRKKPDKDSLKVCATTGKRKACADCVCGLAEELQAENAEANGEQNENPKSSCGSCYLGDAFRCASCPYLGMPAFKPGQTVKLDLDSDI